MSTEEIVKLSRETLVELIQSRLACGKLIEPYDGPERRRTPRWPFPGQVEVRSIDADGNLPHFFDCRDLNDTGMGMCGDTYFPVGSIIELSIHLPELTLYGKGIVRYSMRTARGHMMGVEFMFED